MNFQDQVVLVTGAGRGIGKAIALAFAREGAKVAVNDINPGSCEATANEIITLGGEAAACHADVANKLAVQAMLIDLEDRWGRVDVLINNAGVEPHKPIVQLDEWDWNRTIDVNLKGAFICSQSVGRMMIKQGGGAIVNIASIAGRAAGLRDRSAYVASKMGLIGFTKECAREFAAHHIRVNVVCPGVIITEMTAHLRENAAQLQKWLEDIPLGRLGEPDDVTGLVLFLCSDAARYITGQAINVDGGKVML
ncbi:MAG TPA: SDR family NAD(P)-dependent oxidoreductase [Anaerolineae bacterium]|nr:SDR family NAD(P)-dependent oxidoreductase [Anaerolineae bacterium]